MAREDDMRPRDESPLREGQTVDMSLPAPAGLTGFDRVRAPKLRVERGGRYSPRSQMRRLNPHPLSVSTSTVRSVQSPVRGSSRPDPVVPCRLVRPVGAADYTRRRFANRSLDLGSIPSRSTMVGSIVERPHQSPTVETKADYLGRGLRRLISVTNPTLPHKALPGKESVTPCSSVLRNCIALVVGSIPANATDTILYRLWQPLLNWN